MAAFWPVFVGLVGCSSTASTTQDALKRWDTDHPPSYTYILQEGGGFGGLSTSRVVVDGEETVVAATDMDTNMPEYDARSMSGLMADVLALTLEADSVTVVFDSKIGYLKSVDVDFSTSATDDSYSEGVVCFEESTSPDACAQVPK